MKTYGHVRIFYNGPIPRVAKRRGLHLNLSHLPHRLCPFKSLLCEERATSEVHRGWLECVCDTQDRAGAVLCYAYRASFSGSSRAVLSVPEESSGGRASPALN
jgi:hypothetical protein